MAIGAYQSAVEIFERLQNYEKIIYCYRGMEKNKLAEQVLREQLQIKETPNLLCILGDLTNDHHLYEKAWELSNKRYARAMRSLGSYYFKQDNVLIYFLIVSFFFFKKNDL